MKTPINAFKGYNFQGTIYCYLLCLMNLERKIIELDAEMSVDNNFDDIYIKTNENSYYLQVENYSNINFDEIIIDETRICITGYSPIIIENKNECNNNILIIRNLKLPKKD